jgi:hypothetical protein
MKTLSQRHGGMLIPWGRCHDEVMADFVVECIIFHKIQFFQFVSVALVLFSDIS